MLLSLSYVGHLKQTLHFNACTGTDIRVGFGLFQLLCVVLSLILQLIAKRKYDP